MKLTTIWTMPAMSMPERIERTRDWAAMKIAWALPAKVLYWAAVRGACMVEPDLNPSNVTVTEIMKAVR